ncbi:DUF2887 domain-containing protein [Leptolyngbya sp. FACHB-671]|nr:DUF2887 domain-containing protein [Leptolyngbya sp. FACHB-671]
MFYRLFQRSPSIFFELIGQTASEAKNYGFRSVEIKQTAFRIDGVLLPTGTTKCPVYRLEGDSDNARTRHHKTQQSLPGSCTRRTTGRTTGNC